MHGTMNLGELTEIINVICFAPFMSTVHFFKWQSKKNDLS